MLSTGKNITGTYALTTCVVDTLTRDNLRAFAISDSKVIPHYLPAAENYNYNLLAARN